MNAKKESDDEDILVRNYSTMSFSINEKEAQEINIDKI